MFLTCKSLLLVILHLLVPSAVFSDAICANFSASLIFTLYFPFFIILYEIRAFAIISNYFRFILFCSKIAVIEIFKIPCPFSRILQCNHFRFNFTGILIYLPLEIILHEIGSL